MKNPKITLMIAVLVALVAGYVGNYYLVARDVQKSASYQRHVNQLQVLSQEIANHGGQAADGKAGAFFLLTADIKAFDQSLGYLKNGDSSTGLPPSPEFMRPQLHSVSQLWVDTRRQLEQILSIREWLMGMPDIAGDMAISLAAIQQENAQVVEELLRLGAPSVLVVRAQQQAQLLERMARTMDKVLELDGSNKKLVDNFNRDRTDFLQVLDGLNNGAKSSQLVAANAAAVQASLTRIDELFRSWSARTSEVFNRAEEVASVKQAVVGIYQSADEFSGLLNGLSQAYEANTGRGLMSPLVGLGCALGAFFVMLLIGLLVSQQARRSVAETSVQNEQNQAAILQLLDELADLADGDLRVQATVTENFTGAIADSINFSIDQMRSMVSKINETSAEVSAAADQTRSSVSQLSEASQRQAKEIADVSEAVNEMAVSIDQVSCNAAESSSVAERSVDIASQGAVMVQNTIGGMDKIRGQIRETAKRIKRLGESSQEIGDIVSLINDIADQTNILSLNAAIQASMAGDAGKGFAVVADEVQRLAERSGAAAKQISALVKTIQSDTNEAVSSMEQTTAEVVQGTKLAQDAGVSLGEIESVSKSLAEIIENISDAARQQAASAGKISSTMKSIEEITSQTTEGTKLTATAVGNLADMTNELRSSVTGFKLPSRLPS
ncbi:MAG: methyl-accepting chemotaxis protein [Pseudomonadales bacterium]|jgi:twitching motility protein PilJ|nr:methyl-accepting chemotaxis protein [Pseudomonadales bacterium]MDP4639137.1 methyl-accepting chemotaxis protein [Pseudomonadales bacterium]MDP4766124.1 methyl-accepting chemotaxis protein [Pseudomonadales bacterium]MDP4875110.1 methyl-accepting chemotaxis protein [Pseudomonadales bacterium]MDP4911285.1 methyl-accepting chemotaxis protein [Pseudomonadales bacterium]